jgi:cellulose synthase/poly-beta-1,6-N-acetylglucosamine synthase-like glycosyltransferase
VGAVAGHTDVWNRDHNVLTRMQAMRYFIAFRVHKAAEALFGAVTCCSGCFSGYRRAAVAPVLDRWVNQRFLGRPSTYGDDRSLTNALLPRWRVRYAPNAQAYTVVPERLAVFLRQQPRWKKSWLRESARASRVMWRKHRVMVLMFYLGVLLPLLALQVGEYRHDSSVVAVGGGEPELVEDVADVSFYRSVADRESAADGGVGAAFGSSTVPRRRSGAGRRSARRCR